jgi:hypothetical protein
MKSLFHAAAILALAVSGTTAGAASPAAVPGATIEARDNTTIPPNCTLNPWTHKYVCHKWPKGTVSKA